MPSPNTWRVRSDEVSTRKTCCQPYSLCSRLPKLTSPRGSPALSHIEHEISSARFHGSTDWGDSDDERTFSALSSSSSLSEKNSAKPSLNATHGFSNCSCVSGRPPMRQSSPRSRGYAQVWPNSWSIVSRLYVSRGMMWISWSTGSAHESPAASDAGLFTTVSLSALRPMSSR